MPNCLRRMSKLRLMARCEEIIRIQDREAIKLMYFRSWNENGGGPSIRNKKKSRGKSIEGGWRRQRVMTSDNLRACVGLHSNLRRPDKVISCVGPNTHHDIRVSC
jgi:hypothetical protein